MEIEAKPGKDRDMGKPIKRMTDDELAEAIDRRRDIAERQLIEAVRKTGGFSVRLKNRDLDAIFATARELFSDNGPSDLAKMEAEQEARRKAATPRLEPWKGAGVSRATYYRRKRVAKPSS